VSVQSAIASRRSVRAYRNKPVEREKLNLVLEAARLAPSARNRQEWKFIVVQDKEIIRKLTAAASHNTFLDQAPVVIAACATEAEYVMSCGQLAGTVDTSIALSFIVLQAQELGLGTVWLGAFSEPQVKEILNVPEHVRVVALTPLGYPAEQPQAKPRKSLKEIVLYEQYQ